jgi:hypothetical protein
MADPRGATPDLVLAVVGLSLAIGAAVGAVTAVGTGPAMAVSSLPAVAVLGYALFYAPPRTLGT